MREIKFRAKEKETNTWVYGMLYDYGIDNNNIKSYAIIDNKFKVHSVYSDSIQQYTGLKDKTGKDIYETDILCNIDFNEGYVVAFNEGRFVVYDIDNHVLVTTLNEINKNTEVVSNYYDAQVQYVY